MLKFTIDVEAADTESRVIEGVAVPYGESAILGADRYQFTPGSLRAARSRVPLLLGHDMNQPVGVLTDLVEAEHGAIARFKVDPGPHGDIALAQAQSGSRGGLSIGAEIVNAENDADGVRVVSEALLFETSLVSVPAFASSQITTVHAQLEEPDQMTTDPDTTTDTDAAPEPVEENTDMENENPEVAATRGPIVIAEQARPMPSLDEFVQASVRAERGDRAAAELVRAALTHTAVTDVPGLLPVAYITDIQNRASRDRVIAESVTRRAMPASGTKIVRPTITTGPAGSKLPNFDAVAPSNAVVIGAQEINVNEWAWGGSASIATIERGVPNFLEIAAEEAVADYYLHTEKSLAAQLATNVGSTAGQKATTLGAGAAKVYELAGKPADTIVCSPGTWGKLLDKENTLMFSSGSVSGNPLTGSIFGLRAVCSPNVTAGKAYAFASSTIELWETPTLRITATNVGALQLELGVVAFYAESLKVGSVVEITLA